MLMKERNEKEWLQDNAMVSQQYTNEWTAQEASALIIKQIEKVEKNRRFTTTRA